MNLLELDIVLRLKVIPNHSVHVALPIHIYGCYILKFYTLRRISTRRFLIRSSQKFATTHAQLHNVLFNDESLDDFPPDEKLNQF